MTAPIFIGDELSAAGFRLAGAQVFDDSREHLIDNFRQALADASLVIITSEVAAGLPPVILEEATALATPPVAIVPQAVAGADLPDIEALVGTALGVAT